jgi:hypothetical protein
VLGHVRDHADESDGHEVEAGQPVLATEEGDLAFIQFVRPRRELE